MNTSHHDSISNHAKLSFQSTCWSIILNAGTTPSDESRTALEQLCETYWYPLYAYVRRCGFDEHYAADLTQGFFAKLFENNGISTVHPSRGRFRAFLLASIKNYIRNDRRDRSTIRRGGQIRLVSIDDAALEIRFRAHLATIDDPERLFERDWVEAILSRVLNRLKVQYERAGRERLYQELHRVLVAGGELPPQSEIAQRLDMSVSAVKMSIHRMRKEFARILRSEIAATLQQPEDVDDELRQLLETARC